VGAYWPTTPASETAGGLSNGIRDCLIHNERKTSPLEWIRERTEAKVAGHREKKRGPIIMVGDLNAEWYGDKVTHKDLKEWAETMGWRNEIAETVKAQAGIQLYTMVRNDGKCLPSHLDHIMTNN